MFFETKYPVLSLAVLLLLFGWYARSLVRASRHAKLGTRPPVVPYYLPLGLDTLWDTITVRSPETHVNWQHNRRNASIQLLYKNMARTGTTTFQMRLPGSRPIFTVDPENIKAILATQFNDFGKGESSYKMWKSVKSHTSCPANGSSLGMESST